MEQFSDSSLGKTDIVTDTDKLGQVARFLDLDRSGSGVKSQLSQMPIFARLVINNSGGNLTAGTIVTADATYGPGRGAGAAAVAGTSVGCGVVDPWVSGNIANGSTFWMIEKGPCKFKFTTGTSITIGMVLALGAAGRAKELDHTSLSDQLIFDRCGRVLEAVDTAITNDTLFRGYADFRS